MQTYFTGFFVAVGLIIAIGAQNAWVLGMSVRRIHPWAVSTVCMVIDGVLMAIGVVAFQEIQLLIPFIIPWLTWLGIGMLLWLALQSSIRAVKGQAWLVAAEVAVKVPIAKAVTMAMGISLLNPHVYLDTVILVGGVASASGNPWLFWLGGASASIVWFSLLAAVGRPLSQWLSSPSRWRMFDTLIAVIMVCVAFSLYRSI